MDVVRAAFEQLGWNMTPVNALEEQVQSLELACEHHKMFWQKAEERERGLKEQYEALRSLAEKVRDGWLIQDADTAHLHEACVDLDNWLVRQSTREAVSSPAKGYELHTRTGATPTFAEDDVDYPAGSQDDPDVEHDPATGYWRHGEGRLTPEEQDPATEGAVPQAVQPEGSRPTAGDTAQSPSAPSPATDDGAYWRAQGGVPSPASDPFDAGGQVTHVHDPASEPKP